jgi:2,4-dienoyl-CoA reductase-like NADH-dependent reductase (Old Yellow Enzyme family)
MLRVSLLLELAGINAIELSGGTGLKVSQYSSSRVYNPDSEEQEVYYQESARQFKQTVKVPLILVGGIRSYEVAARLIEKEEADYIALSRPLIREPDLVRRWQSGDRRRATCISCNQCFTPAKDGVGIYCTFEGKK